MMPAPFIELELQYVDKASLDCWGPISRLAHELIDQLISFDFALNTTISFGWYRASSNAFRERVLNLTEP